MKGVKPGISERPGNNSSNKFKLHFCTRTGSPHTSKGEIRKKRPLESMSVVVRAVDSLKGFFIKRSENSSSREGGLLHIKVSNSENAVVLCSVILLLLCSCFFDLVFRIWTLSECLVTLL